jgi:hypothetical protein
LIYNEEAEETYKEEEMIQKEDARTDADSKGGTNASPELQSPQATHSTVMTQVLPAKA